MEKMCIAYSFLADNPNILGNFLSIVRQDQLGENYLTSSHTWWFKNALGEKYALHVRDIQAPPDKSCMRQFPPAWYFTVYEVGVLLTLQRHKKK